MPMPITCWQTSAEIALMEDDARGRASVERCLAPGERLCECEFVLIRADLGLIVRK